MIFIYPVLRSLLIAIGVSLSWIPPVLATSCFIYLDDVPDYLGYCRSLGRNDQISLMSSFFGDEEPCDHISELQLQTSFKHPVVILESKLTLYRGSLFIDGYLHVQGIKNTVTDLTLSTQHWMEWNTSKKLLEPQNSSLIGILKSLARTNFYRTGSSLELRLYHLIRDLRTQEFKEASLNAAGLVLDEVFKLWKLDEDSVHEIEELRKALQGKNKFTAVNRTRFREVLMRVVTANTGSEYPGSGILLTTATLPEAPSLLVIPSHFASEDLDELTSSDVYVGFMNGDLEIGFRSLRAQLKFVDGIL